MSLNPGRMIGVYLLRKDDMDYDLGYRLIAVAVFLGLAFLGGLGGWLLARVTIKD